MGFSKVWLNTQRLVEEINGLIKITLGRDDHTQMVVGLHKVRTNLQNLLKVLY